MKVTFFTCPAFFILLITLLSFKVEALPTKAAYARRNRLAYSVKTIPRSPISPKTLPKLLNSQEELPLLKRSSFLRRIDFNGKFITKRFEVSKEAIISNPKLRSDEEEVLVKRTPSHPVIEREEHSIFSDSDVSESNFQVPTAKVTPLHPVIGIPSGIIKVIKPTGSSSASTTHPSNVTSITPTGNATGNPVDNFPTLTVTLTLVPTLVPVPNVNGTANSTASEVIYVPEEPTALPIDSLTTGPIKIVVPTSSPTLPPKSHTSAQPIETPSTYPDGLVPRSMSVEEEGEWEDCILGVDEGCEPIPEL